MTKEELLEQANNTNFNPESDYFRTLHEMLVSAIEEENVEVLNFIARKSYDDGLYIMAIHGLNLFGK